MCVCKSDLSCSKTMYHRGVIVHFLTAGGFRAFLHRLGLGGISTVILVSFLRPKKHPVMRDSKRLLGLRESVDLKVGHCEERLADPEACRPAPAYLHFFSPAGFLGQQIFE